jgi:predicted RNase H-like HicB family nuclease
VYYDVILYIEYKVATLLERTIMKLKIVLEPSDDGGYTVFVPALPGCISEGDTEEEALSNIEEAIALYLEPTDDDFVTDDKAIVRELVV